LTADKQQHSLPLALSLIVDQFIEPHYLPQHLRAAAMGRRKIEIKAIKDDRNRSVYVSPVSQYLRDHS